MSVLFRVDKLVPALVDAIIITRLAREQNCVHSRDKPACEPPENRRSSTDDRLRCPWAFVTPQQSQCVVDHSERNRISDKGESGPIKGAVDRWKRKWTTGTSTHWRTRPATAEAVTSHLFTAK
ncbi:hypothetical protein EVAR_47803_1 [Eumeta japonica]|uniref:Uncharacterized protein n=1 Tax=Eumeta variegata TaxID=151549 RepID=A0A4C1Z743_EUMVA|nr:hypothetical protein EVAR_47803_1 [Eumeta japonica]